MKTKIDIKKTSRASVSIMLSFLMLPVYTFGAAVADSVRISSAKTMAAVICFFMLPSLI